MTNVEHFRSAYIETLTAAVVRKPEEYGYGADKVPAIVDKMIASAAKGEANLGAAMKAAARRCGIKPTQKAIREYLTTGTQAVPLTDAALKMLHMRALPEEKRDEVIIVDGYRYKIETIADATGSRWWVNCWLATTPYHSLGASSSRPMPIEESALVEAMNEAKATVRS